MCGMRRSCGNWCGVKTAEGQVEIERNREMGDDAYSKVDWTCKRK